jgi:prepilin-type N-terminal cleavage/methylation domain-containing protein
MIRSSSVPSTEGARLRRTPLQPLGADSGLTLIEMLVTVAILGTAFVAIVGGMTISIFGSDLHRKEATAETVLRSYGDSVKTRTGWDGCSATAAGYMPAAVGFTNPAASQFSVTATAVEFWAPSGSTGSWTSSCPGGVDTGLQRVSLQVRSLDGRATETLQVVRRKP